MPFNEQIAKTLARKGNIVVMPTDTVYGVVGRAKDQQAVERLYALKRRHAKPGTLLVADIQQLVDLGLKRRYLKAVEQFWPGAVSVVVPVGDPKLDYLTQGLPDLAVRIPDDDNVREVLKLTGPLITSSANEPGEPPAETLTQAKHYFDDRVDAYFDGGDLKGRLPSTVIRVVDDAVEVLRQGSVDITGA